MDPREKVSLYLDVTRQNPDAELDVLAKALVDEGLTPEDAEALIAFVPMGFGYVLLSSQGVTLSESFEVLDPSTREKRRGFLIDQLIFQAALTTADQMFAESEAVEYAYQIARSSAEFGAVNRLCHGGANLHEISLTEPVLTRLPIESV